MLKEFPKIVGRDYIIGFFLPALCFLLTIHVLLPPFQPILQSVNKTHNLFHVAVLGLLSFLGGIVLMVFNRMILRVLEGYGRMNPVRILRPLRLRKFRRLKSELNQIERTPTMSSKLATKRAKILQQLAYDFPDAEEHVLPTKLGNTIRAFEVYSRVQYGLEGIQGWERIYLLLSKEDREHFQAAKTQLDLWANFSILGWILATWLIAQHFFYETKSSCLLILGLLGFGFLALFGARRAAASWGEIVRAAVDVYLPKLGKRLGCTLPPGSDQAREFWTSYSQAIVYRLPEKLPQRDA